MANLFASTAVTTTLIPTLTPPPPLSAQNVQLCVGSRVLLDQFNWQLDAGQCWCVIGRNGAGKSTLLRTLAGLQTAQQGQVRLAQRPLSAWPLAELARQRAYLPQSQSDAFAYRVIEMVLMARHPYHAHQYWEGSDDHLAAQAALAQMDVAELAERDIRSLSGGERQRVAIAALLAQNTPILLLDEPTNALDLGHQVRVMQLLSNVCREQGKSVVLVAHDLNLVQKAATHALLLMGEGRWLAGTLEQVMRIETLSDCIGHPLRLIEQGSQRWFIPS
jgi:iron complex transport system ATP-binding protein